MPTVVAPLTVAPLAGLVNAAVSGGGWPPPFCTMTGTVVEPVLFAASRTETVSVCGPSGVRNVSQGSVTWDADEFSDHTIVPAALRVYA